MPISVEVVLDSYSPDYVRLTTLQLRYPRFIHAELMTHRVFSRNASSSRAIPVQRLIDDVIEDPAMPLHWGKNKPGMQAVEELTDDELARAKQLWTEGMHRAVLVAREMALSGLHKQLVNRVLEPFAHINVLVTATDFENFFGLRCHPDAQPELRALAEAMREAMRVSRPQRIEHGGWHLPYLRDDDRKELLLRDQVKISVARCARVSYLTREGKRPDIDEDLQLYTRLVGSHPLHASPAEHQATPDRIRFWSNEEPRWAHPEEHGNFYGWCQYRKSLAGECAMENRLVWSMCEG